MDYEAQFDERLARIDATQKRIDDCLAGLGTPKAKDEQDGCSQEDRYRRIAELLRKAKGLPDVEGAAGQTP